jgi:hypothetical protein
VRKFVRPSIEMGGYTVEAYDENGMLMFIHKYPTHHAIHHYGILEADMNKDLFALGKQPLTDEEIAMIKALFPDEMVRCQDCSTD